MGLYIKQPHLISVWIHFGPVKTGPGAHVSTYCLTIVFLAGCSTVSCHKGTDRLVVLRNVSRITSELYTFQKCNIQPSELEASARDRDVWRTVCEAGLSDFMNGWASTSMKFHSAVMWPRLSRRLVHAVLTAAESVPQSSIYRVIFRSTLLIASTTRSSAKSSSITTDFSSSSSMLNI